MEIWEARELLNKAYGDFLTKEAPNNPRILIILEQIGKLCDGPPLLVLQGSMMVKPNKALKGSITRKKKRMSKIEQYFRRRFRL